MRRQLPTIVLSGILASLPAFAAPSADCPKELIPKAAAGTQATESPTDRKFRRELEMVANVEAAWRGCADVAGFAKTFQPAYDEWTRRYKNALQRYQQNAHARRYVECGIEDEKRRMQTASESSRKQKADLCRDVMGPGIVRIVDGD